MPLIDTIAITSSCHGFPGSELSDHGVNASLYWRCADLDLQTPMVPISAIDGCGIPDLLLFTMLYAQSLPVLQQRLLKKDEVRLFFLLWTDS